METESLSPVISTAQPRLSRLRRRNSPYFTSSLGLRYSVIWVRPLLHSRLLNPAHREAAFYFGSNILWQICKPKRLQGRSGSGERVWAGLPQDVGENRLDWTLFLLARVWANSKLSKSHPSTVVANRSAISVHPVFHRRLNLLLALEPFLATGY